MFIAIKENQMVNLDNVDAIWLFHNNDGNYEIRFIKQIDRRNDCVVGTALFETKEDMEKFIDMHLKPLTYNSLGM